MTKISEKTLAKLKAGEVKPKPKWRFLMRDSMVWLAFAVTVGVGSFAFAAMLFQLVNYDFDIYQKLGRGPVEHFFSSLPFIWIGLLAVFLFLAVYNLAHTRSGYKYKAILIWLGSVGLSIVLGTIFFYLGFGHLADRSLSKLMPPYQEYELKRQAVWHHPSKGLLAGEVVWVGLVDEQGVVRDFDGGALKGEESLDGEGLIESSPAVKVVNWSGEWLIDVSDADWPRGYEIEIGDKVGVIGVEVGESLFKAEALRPLDRGPGILKSKVNPEVGPKLKLKKEYLD
jgi:hypothetical protein